MRNDIMSKLSVVLPAYNEELMVGKTCRVLAQVLTEAQIPYSPAIQRNARPYGAKHYGLRAH